MLQLLQTYTAYNHWANKTITDAVLEMDEHLHQQIVKSSFPNLYATILHVWDAESIWWQRMQGHVQLFIPSRELNPTINEAVSGLLHQSLTWSNFMKTSTDEKLQLEFEYKNIKGEAFKCAVWQSIQHLCNHSTYHRGQLVTIMRELGGTQIPVTDYIHWCRNFN